MSRRLCQLLNIILTIILFSSCGSKSEVSKEQVQTSEYLRAFGQVLGKYKSDMPAFREEMAKEIENLNWLETQSIHTSQLRLAHNMDQLFERMITFISDLEGLIPPEKLHEHKAVNLECSKTQAEFIKQIAEALRKQDKMNYESQMERYEQFVRSCNDRIEGSLRNAGYKSPEDVRKAMGAGLLPDA
jgi:hypothetical protein